MDILEKLLVDRLKIVLKQIRNKGLVDGGMVLCRVILVFFGMVIRFFSYVLY